MNKLSRFFGRTFRRSARISLDCDDKRYSRSAVNGVDPLAAVMHEQDFLRVSPAHGRRTNAAKTRNAIAITPARTWITAPVIPSRVDRMMPLLVMDYIVAMSALTCPGCRWFSSEGHRGDLAIDLSTARGRALCQSKLCTSNCRGSMDQPRARPGLGSLRR